MLHEQRVRRHLTLRRRSTQEQRKERIVVRPVVVGATLDDNAGAEHVRRRRQRLDAPFDNVAETCRKQLARAP